MAAPASLPWPLGALAAFACSPWPLLSKLRQVAQKRNRPVAPLQIAPLQVFFLARLEVSQRIQTGRAFVVFLR